MWNLLLPEIRVLEALLPGLSEVRDDPVDQLRVAHLVLHLGGQGKLALEGRRAEDPLALGQHAHDCRLPCISMNLISLARYSSGIGSFGLDLAAALHVLKKLLLVHGLSLPSERSLGSILLCPRGGRS